MTGIKNCIPARRFACVCIGFTTLITAFVLCARYQDSVCQCVAYTEKNYFDLPTNGSGLGSQALSLSGA